MLKDMDDQFILDMNQQLFLRMGMEFYLGKEFDESLKWLDKVVSCRGLSAYAEAKAYFYKAEIAKARGENFQEFFNQSIEILEKAENPIRDGLYLLASLYKENNLEKAKETFNALVNTFPIDNLTGGAYFHLGEIAFKDEDYVESKKCFKRCLSIIKDHGRAKEYLEKMKY